MEIWENTNKRGEKMELEYYRKLLGDFFNNKISIEEFYTLFNEAYNAESGDMDDYLFAIMETIFSDLDKYSPDYTEDLADSYIITGETLRKRIKEDAIRLDDYIKNKFVA